MKKAIVLLLTCATVALTGCSSVDSLVEKVMLEQSGILDDVNYQQYKQYSSNGQLDADGYYVEENASTAYDSQQGKIWVTFSENSNLDVRYYADAKHENLLEKQCYLNPGDSIYAVVTVKNSNSMYVFSSFRIYEYDADGKRAQTEVLNFKEQHEDYILTLPKDYNETSISIVPVGKYNSKAISLNDYYIDENNNVQNPHGTWSINGQECTSGSVEISPLSSYIVSYKYDSDEYFLLSSEPEVYYSDETTGEIIFAQCDAGNETVEYSVELCKRFSRTVISDTDRKVRRNGDVNEISKNDELVFENLKYGDVVKFETDKKWGNLENSRELLLIREQKISQDGYNYLYILTVPDKDGEFIFDPQAYSYEHGEIAFICYGEEMTVPQKLSKGRKVYYEARSGSVDDGYFLAGDDKSHYIVIGEESETIAALESIHFTKKISVTVSSLKQPEYGGTITYRINDKLITSENVETYSGEKITMEFNPWDGWYLSKDLETAYEVNDEISQNLELHVKTYDQKSMTIGFDDIFLEDDAHKPSLTVWREKNVSESLKIDIDHSDHSDMSSEDVGEKIGEVISKIGGKECIDECKKIGTEKPIKVTITGGAIHKGEEAVRMIITLANDEESTTEIRYVENLSKEIQPIYIYQPGTNSETTDWYSTIEISIGVVEVEHFTLPKAADNSSITVRNADTNEVLTDSSIIEDSQKVVVTISPDQGYYISGKKVSNGVYVDTMKYSEFKKEINDIIEKHPISKYCVISLDASDKYAAYVYKLDGEIVSGKINAKEGQKLELTYEITDSSYQLAQASGGLPIVGWGASDTKANKSIEITSEMDGKTITKADFDIETKKVG